MVLAGSLMAQAGKGTFLIRGSVVDAITGQPMDRTDVSIGSTEHLDQTLQQLLTGKDGSFSFSGLSQGKYWLSASKNGFRKQTYEQHGGFFSAVVVGPALSSDHIVFRIHPDASISGKINDSENEVVPNAIVSLFRRDASSGFVRTFQIAQTVSDDRGYYHFGHLEAGRYFVAVSAQPWYNSIAASLRESSEYDVVAADGNDLDRAYPFTYYPGTTNPSLASPIVLNEAQSASADIDLMAIPSLRLRINHAASSAAQISLKQYVFGVLADVPSTQHYLPDDTLEISGIPPGTYILEFDSPSPTVPLHGRVIELTADQETDAKIGVAIPAITGKVQMEGGLTLAGQAFVRLWNSQRAEAFDAVLGTNGKFAFDEDLILPGTYSVFLINGESLMVGTITATGAKVTGQSIYVNGKTPVSLSIQLSHALSQMTGTAQRSGKPLPGALIMLVPENANSNLALFRRDQSDSDGSFSLKDILPGKYKIVGIQGGWDLEWADPAVLKTHFEQAVDVEIRANTKYEMTVKVQ